MESKLEDYFRVSAARHYPTSFTNLRKDTVEKVLETRKETREEDR